MDMLNDLFNQETYRAIKSGFYLDFFFKKFIIMVCHTYLLNISLFFLDKYLVEYLPLKVFWFIYVTLYVLKSLQKLSFVQLVGGATYILFTFMFISYVISW